MELVKLMQSIAENNPPKYSVWFGEEQKILDIYLQKITELGYKIVNCDTVSTVISQISRKSLDNTLKAFVVVQDIGYTEKEEIWANIKRITAGSKHLLILRYDNLNKTRKFYKQNKDVCVEFPLLDPQVLVGYINNLLPNFNVKYAEKLCEICGNSYGRICLECDKIKQYSEATKSDYDKSFRTLIEQDAIYADIGDITFDLTGAVLYGDVKKSAEYLMQAKQKGEPALVIASILYNGFRNMLAYQGLGKDKSNPTERTGLDNKQLWAVKKNIGGYSLTELLRNTKICQEIESGIKMGKMEDDIALDYMIVSCLFQ